MSQESSQCLMKMTTINNHLKEALNTEKIYATPLNKLNDPVEQITLVAPLSSNENEAFDANYKNNCGVYCVTEFSKNHFSGPLLPMWAHYGDDHKGVCLVIRPKDSKRSEWIKVKYIDSTDIQTLDTKGKSQLQIAKAVLSYKLKPWSTESEHRLVFPPEHAGQSHEWNDFFELKQIIFGYKCTPVQVNELLCHLSKNLLRRVQLNEYDNDFLDIRQVREPTSVISDFAPFRITLARDALRISGHYDTNRNNENQFYPLGQLYKGQIPACLIPDLQASQQSKG